LKIAAAFALLAATTAAVAAPPANDTAAAMHALAAVCVDKQADAAAMREALAASGWAQAPSGPDKPMLIHRQPTPLFSKAFGAVRVTLDAGDDGTCAAAMIGAAQATVRLAAEVELAGRKLKYILAGDVNDNDRRVLMLHYARGGHLSEIVLIASTREPGQVTVNFLPLRAIDGVDGDAALRK